MIGIITLISTLTISVLVTRIGAVSLALTGLSREVARFQARSAFTGVGFTTSEAENVMHHPVRRRIISTLMICGNVGIAAVIAGTIATFAESASTASDWFWRIIALSAGLLTLWIVGTHRWVDDTISRIIEWALLRWTSLDVHDYVSLLRLTDGYVVMELKVNSSDWIANKSLADCRLSSEGVLVLGINRANGKYVGSPNGKTMIGADDVISLYGPIDRLEELDIRQKGYHGDLAHRIAIATQNELARQQEQASDTVETTTDKGELDSPDD